MKLKYERAGKILLEVIEEYKVYNNKLIALLINQNLPPRDRIMTTEIRYAIICQRVYKSFRDTDNNLLFVRRDKI